MHRDPDEPNTESMARAWWVTGAGKGEILETPLVTSDDEQKDELVTVQALYSGISRGTESLVFHGRVPKSEYAAMRAPFQEGDFPWPVKYGYASVCRVSGPNGVLPLSASELLPGAGVGVDASAQRPARRASNTCRQHGNRCKRPLGWSASSR